MSNFKTYRPGKSKDYRFVDKLVKQQLEIGGTLIHAHLYLSPIAQPNSNNSTINSQSGVNALTIEDVLLVENRDRNYDPTVIDLTGAYIVQDLDYNLSQFGIMINTSILYINFHINDMIDRAGRKLIAGDVLEIVHRRDEVLLDDTIPYIPAYYVVKDVARAADGYSATWLPHLLRVKCEPMPSSQEYSQILDTTIKGGQTLQDIISNSQTIQNANDAVVAQGDSDVPTKNLNSDSLYIAPNGTALNTDTLRQWSFNNAGLIPNTNTLAPSGTRFPLNPLEGDWFLRTDYQPSRLFQRDVDRWCVRQEVWRDRPWTQANRALENFLNDTETTTLSDNTTISEQQPLSNPIPSQDPTLE